MHFCLGLVHFTLVLIFELGKISPMFWPLFTSTVGKRCIWEAAHRPLCKGKGRKMTYEKLILSDFPDVEIQEISTVARNREEWKSMTKLDWSRLYRTMMMTSIGSNFLCFGTIFHAYLAQNPMLVILCDWCFSFSGAVSMSEFQSFNFSRLNALSLVRQINKIKAEKPTTKGRFSEQTFLSDFQDPLLEKLRERCVCTALMS